MRRVVAIWIMILVMFAGTFGLAIANNFVVNEVDATINKTERVCSDSYKNQECRYLVFTDKGVFENVDSLIRFKFNSSDLHNELKDGNIYTLKLVGWRVPFFSMYPNVVKIIK